MRTFVILVLLLLAPAMVEARSEGKLLAYRGEQVWPTAVRFIVVDQRAKVLDKDPDAGYVLFELVDDGKVYRGSLELLTFTTESGTNVRFVISLVDRPNWMEIAMLTRLEQKLRAELGAPNPPKPKPKQPPKDNDEPPNTESDKKPVKPDSIDRAP
jgi:hypothetical protein